MSDDGMTCCPLSGGDSGDGCVEVFSEGKPRAKKDHRCLECGETIAKGTRYERITGKFDGDVSTYKTCLSCVEIRNHFACNSGWIFGEVWNQIEENFFPEMKAGGPCMQGLSPAAKQRLFDRRLAWMEES